jgi:hypothetical protein
MLFNQLGGNNMVDMSKLFCILIAGLAIMSYTVVGLAAPEIIAEGKTAVIKAEATKASDKAADIKKAVAIPEAAKAVAEEKTADVKAEATKVADKAADIKKAVAIPEAAKAVAEGKTAAIKTEAIKDAAKEEAEIQYGAEPKIKSEGKK